MSDHETIECLKPDERDAELLLYDFLKYLGTLAVLILGGVASLAGANGGLSKRTIAVVIFIVASAALVAIVAADRVVVLRQTGKPVDRSTHWSRGLCMWLLAVGTGVFLSNWVDALK